MAVTTPQTRAGGGIDLGIGHPSPNLLPVELLRRAAEHRFESGDRFMLQYGAEQGDPAFREQLAAFLASEQSAVRTAETRLAVTGGVSYILDQLCTLFTSPGDGVVVEDPTYFLALKIFSDHKLHPVSIPVDERGVDVKLLESTIKKHRPRLIYTIPFHQNPSGASLAPERRESLFELAERFGVTIVSDEAYALLAYDGMAPPVPLAEQCDRALSLGSFSKILAPGLRLGWLIGAPQVVQRICASGMLDSGGGYNPFGAAVVRSALEIGVLGGHLRRLRAAYERRRETLYRAVAPLESRGWKITAPAGGYFLWLVGPEETDAEEALEAATEFGVHFIPGARFSAAGGQKNALRLSFSFCDMAELEQGGRLLVRALDEPST